jgi:hypothetical protein
MAETSGLVQRLTVVSATLTCVWVGPKSNSSTLLTINSDGTASGSAFAANLTQTLAAAATNYRTVTCGHGDSSSQVTSVRVDPV